jgi:hypothetical protein
VVSDAKVKYGKGRFGLRRVKRERRGGKTNRVNVSVGE